MRNILHIVTVSGDSFTTEVISVQKEDKSREVTVFDLTEAEPDYKRLLREIFDADSIHVW
ncbi:MAG: hypothetical protein O2960_09680 [Verrucomicrobia bacterium]|nr:hypothetical protein [Verrucomicrobiota bacterium]